VLQRFVGTSVGGVVLSFAKDDRVRIALLDLDGWERPAKTQVVSAATLAKGLVDVVGLPTEEAERVARETLSQLES
jgi:hypothetical protein